MSRYLFMAAYTGESWATQLRTQQDARERVGGLIEHCGGTLNDLYYAFGESDICGLADFPDEESAAAFSLAASAGGALRSIQTTKLLTIEQGMDAMRKAAEASASYTPPTGAGLPRQTAGSGRPAGATPGPR